MKIESQQNVKEKLDQRLCPSRAYYCGPFFFSLLMRPTISSWDTNRLSNLLFDLLLREKRLQAIKEKPSLASSSFCWPFLFFINGPTGRWQQPMMGIQGKITIIFFLFIVLLQENNKMKEKMMIEWSFCPWIRFLLLGLRPNWSCSCWCTVESTIRRRKPIDGQINKLEHFMKEKRSMCSRLIAINGIFSGSYSFPHG